jgi:NAD(P)H dehydrogenase (quinone)
MTEILVLFYSRYGATAELARQVARGVDSVAGAAALIRTVPPVAPVTETAAPPVPDSGAPYVDLADLERCDGLILGSPVRFGNMAAPLKAFLDTTAALWISGALAGRPAGVFASGQTQHGGQESTLLSMMLPLLHHGMFLVGVPFTEKSITSTEAGGTPYGASHVARGNGPPHLTDEERATAQALGRRVAHLAVALARAGHGS